MYVNYDIMKRTLTTSASELVDLLFSNGQNVYRAEVGNVCFVIIIRIYKVTNRSVSKSTIFASEM